MAWETFISPLAACCWLALIWTVAAKTIHGADAGILESWDWLRVVGIDIFVYSTLGLLTALAAARWPVVGPLFAGPFVLVLLALAVLNGFFLLETGEQGTWYDLMDAMARRKELTMVLEDIGTPRIIWGTSGALLSALVGVMSARWFTLKRRPIHSSQRASLRARAWGVSASLGLVFLIALPAKGFQQTTLRKNVVFLVAKTAWARRLPAKWKKFDKEVSPLESSSLEQFASSDERPNVLMVILESTRFDHTALAGEDALADTPELAKWAETSAVATTVRSVLPHTTKSMFSMLCGRYPTMQKGRAEPSLNGNVVCLPELMREAGYDTAFGQSAFGTFESRPQLVTNFGFEKFQAFEDIKGEKVSYLSSDDASLHRFFRNFLNNKKKQKDQRPFFVTLLTSATHHSYRLSASEKKRAKAAEKPMKKPADRYARLVEAEDRLLQRLRKLLERRGLWENTIIVVVGDHGEGFGDHGVKQHDNNYFEEGLRVPFLLRGPGIEAQVVDHNASLVDFLPTLAAALGIAPNPSAGLPGHDIFAADYTADAPKYFSCYKPHKCFGYVQGTQKFVQIPRDDISLVFDLDTDPDERSPSLPTRDMKPQIAALKELTAAHRYRGVKLKFEKQVYYDIWRCSKRGYCKHPNAFKLKHRYDPADPERKLTEEDDVKSADKSAEKGPEKNAEIGPKKNAKIGPRKDGPADGP
jgi:arylsulfatase A-like enzyme